MFDPLTFHFTAFLKYFSVVLQLIHDLFINLNKKMVASGSDWLSVQQTRAQFNLAAKHPSSISHLLR